MNWPLSKCHRTYIGNVQVALLHCLLMNKRLADSEHWCRQRRAGSSNAGRFVCCFAFNPSSNVPMRVLGNTFIHSRTWSRSIALCCNDANGKKNTCSQHKWLQSESWLSRLALKKQSWIKTSGPQGLHLKCSYCCGSLTARIWEFRF